MLLLDPRPRASALSRRRPIRKLKTIAPRGWRVAVPPAALTCSLLAVTARGTITWGFLQHTTHSSRIFACISHTTRIFYNCSLMALLHTNVIASERLTYLGIVAHVVRVGVGIILIVSLLTGGAASRRLAVLSIRVARSWLSLVHLTCDTCNRYCELRITTHENISPHRRRAKRGCGRRLDTQVKSDNKGFLSRAVTLPQCWHNFEQEQSKLRGR